MSYQEKYLKYKNKYLSLKKLLEETSFNEVTTTEEQLHEMNGGFFGFNLSESEIAEDLGHKSDNQNLDNLLVGGSPEASPTAAANMSPKSAASANMSPKSAVSANMSPKSAVSANMSPKSVASAKSVVSANMTSAPPTNMNAAPTNMNAAPTMGSVSKPSSPKSVASANMGAAPTMGSVSKPSSPKSVVSANMGAAPTMGSVSKPSSLTKPVLSARSVASMKPAPSAKIGLAPSMGSTSSSKSVSSNGSIKTNSKPGKTIKIGNGKDAVIVGSRDFVVAPLRKKDGTIIETEDGLRIPHVVKIHDIVSENKIKIFDNLMNKTFVIDVDDVFPLIQDNEGAKDFYNAMQLNCKRYVDTKQEGGADLDEDSLSDSASSLSITSSESSDSDL